MSVGGLFFGLLIGRGPVASVVLGSLAWSPFILARFGQTNGLVLMLTTLTASEKNKNSH
jgi:hypothetical protein